MAGACDTCRKDDFDHQLYEGEVNDKIPMTVGTTKYCLCPCYYHEGAGHECFPN
jgi:hypothetical protein